MVKAIINVKCKYQIKGFIHKLIIICHTFLTFVKLILLKTIDRAMSNPMNQRAILTEKLKIVNNGCFDDTLEILFFLERCLES